MNYIKRHIKDYILKASGTFPFIKILVDKNKNKRKDVSVSNIFNYIYK